MGYDLPMNKLPMEKQTAVVSALVEGNSIRSIERMTGIHRDTIMRLGTRIGESCKSLMDSKMVDLPCKQIQVDEIWSFVGKKERRIGDKAERALYGDFWTWVAIDAETKAIPSFIVGKRYVTAAHAFMADLHSRLRNRVQISADALKTYIDAIDASFQGDVDFGQAVKSYEAEPMGPGRYSPPRVAQVTKNAVFGEPDFSKISTSYVERQNLTMRMSIRRLTRLTNAFSKKLENLKAAIALHFAHYNFVRVHSSLKATPAMALGIDSRPWTIQELIEASI